MPDISMNHEPSLAPRAVTRRELLLRACACPVVAAGFVSPIRAEPAEPIQVQIKEPEFVPENDYPFFGFEPQTS